MDQYGPHKLTACRQLFSKEDEDEDLNSKMIREEMRKDQDEFKKKYNYDPTEDKPIPGKFVYTFDEAKGVLVGKPVNRFNNGLIEINQTDDNHKDNNKTPKKENDQTRNQNGLDLKNELREQE